MGEPRSTRGGSSEPVPSRPLLGSSLLGKKRSRVGVKNMRGGRAGDRIGRPASAGALTWRIWTAAAGPRRRPTTTGWGKWGKLLGRDRRDSPGAELGSPVGGFVGAAAVIVIRTCDRRGIVFLHGRIRSGLPFADAAAILCVY
jgi:hypothetical protein